MTTIPPNQPKKHIKERKVHAITKHKEHKTLFFFEKNDFFPGDHEKFEKKRGKRIKQKINRLIRWQPRSFDLINYPLMRMELVDEQEKTKYLIGSDFIAYHFFINTI